MKILVCYGYSNLNLGDSAICLGIASLMSDVLNKPEIHFMNFSSEITGNAKRTVSHLDSHGYKVVPRPGHLSKLKLLTTYFKKPSRDMIRFIENGKYDLVLMNGGHFLYDVNDSFSKKVKNRLRMNFVFEPIFAAYKLNISSGIMGQSIGPLRESGYAKSILNKVGFILTRESISAEEVNNALRANKALSFIDMAFFMKNKAVDAKLNKNKIAINLRQVVASGGMEVSESTKTMLKEKAVNLIREIINKTSYDVVLVSQVKGTTSTNAENDNLIHAEIIEKEFSGSNRVTMQELHDEEYDAIAYYKENCVALISTRYHGLIFSMIAGVPAFALNVNGVGNKIRGLYSDLRLEEFVFDIDTMDKLSSIDSLLAIYPSSSSLADRIMMLKKQFSMQFKKALK